MANGKPPIDRAGQKWRCYRVVKTVGKQPSNRHHVLKCTKCGASTYSAWSETAKGFSPMPCDCGDGRETRIKAGDIRNNKKVLKVEQVRSGGQKRYSILIQCMNCGEKDTISNLYILSKHKKRKVKYCRFCEWDAIRVKFEGRTFGTWKVTKDAGMSFKCECKVCGHRITEARNQVWRIKDKECPKCRKNRKAVDEEKIMFLLYREGYAYYMIADYFGTNASRVRTIVNKVATDYKGPL